jgi:spore maturation protein CgeB
VVAYENIHNAIQKIEYYLQNDEERIKVAKAGYERAIKYYTYDLVWKRILSVMSQD